MTIAVFRRLPGGALRLLGSADTLSAAIAASGRALDRLDSAWVAYEVGDQPPPANGRIHLLRHRRMVAASAVILAPRYMRLVTETLVRALFGAMMTIKLLHRRPASVSDAEWSGILSLGIDTLAEHVKLLARTIDELLVALPSTRPRHRSRK